MNSLKVKTQKKLSVLLGLALAIVTLFSGATANSSHPNTVNKMSTMEAELIAEIDQMFLEEEAELSIIEQIAIEEVEDGVKVYGENNELLGEGKTQDSKTLRKLVNQAELISEFAGTKYYSIVK